MPKKRSTNTAIARRIGALEAKLDTLADRHAPELQAGQLHVAAKAIENFGLTRILAAAGAWLVFITVLSFWFDYAARHEERTARIEEAEFRKLAQIATAWEVLLRPVGGDTGKGNALNTLLRAGEFLDNADLSCANVGTFRDGACVTPPQFNGVDLFYGDFWTFEEENFIGATTTLFKPLIGTVSFIDAHITDLRAEGLRIDGGFKGVKGQDWIVRTTTVRPVEMGATPPFDGFACIDCLFDDTVMPWEFFRLLGAPKLSNSSVEISEGHRRRLENSFRNELGRSAEPLPTSTDTLLRSVFAQSARNGVQPRLFTDAPTLFEWKQNPVADEPIFGSALYTAPLPAPAEEAIFWDIYEVFNFCLNRADYDALLPQLVANTEKWYLEAERRYQAEIEAGNEPLISPNFEQPTWDPDREQKHRVRSQSQLSFENFRAPVPEQAYQCGFRFSEVESLLRPRLIEMRSKGSF